MALELITGHTGAAHVSAADDGKITASILGPSRPIMSTDGGKLVAGGITVQTENLKIEQDGGFTHRAVGVEITLDPFYQPIGSGGIVKSDATATVTFDSPSYDIDYATDDDRPFIVVVYIPDLSTPALAAVAGEQTSTGDPVPPVVDGVVLRQIKVHASKASMNDESFKSYEDMTPCLPTADSAIDWLTIDKSDPTDPPYQSGVNLITIYDQDRIDAGTGGGVAVASAWKAYTPATGTIAARPSSIDLGNVEAHIWCRGYYGDDTTQIDADEGGIFTLTGYAEFDAGSGVSNIKLSPTGSDDVSWAFVVSDPFHFASRRGMTMQILNGASYAIVGGTAMKSNLSDYFGPTSLLQVDLHLVKTSGGWQLVAYIPLTPGAGDMSIFQIKLFLMADALIHPCQAGDLPSYASELPIAGSTASGSTGGGVGDK